MMRDKFNVDRRAVAGFVGAAATLVFAAGSVSTAIGAQKSTMSKSSTTSTSTRSTATAADRAFADAAAKGGAMEVAMGQFAQRNGASQAVKSFGRRMETDHKKANEDLEKTARSAGLSLDWRPNSADRATLAKLAHLHGAAFDKAYKADMVKDHEKDVAAFEKEAAHGRDPRIRAFAQRTLPVLKEHLQMAQAMQSGKPYAHRMSTPNKMKPMNKQNKTKSATPSTTNKSTKSKM